MVLKYKFITKEVLLVKLRKSNGEQTIKAAMVNVLDGLGPKSRNPIMVTEMRDGTYRIDDGFHRVAKAILARKSTIKAVIRQKKENR